jgi:hypothetical protein
LIDNRISHGVAGYHVVMPLELGSNSGGGSRYVLVNRGWIAGNADRSRLPEVRTPEATVEITGLAVTPSRRFLELSDRVAEGRVWQNLTLDRYRKAVPIALQPVVIQQETALDDGLVREWDPPNLGVDKHYGYAFHGLRSPLPLVFYPRPMSNAAPKHSRRSRATCGSFWRLRRRPGGGSTFSTISPPAHTVNYGELIEARARPRRAHACRRRPFRLAAKKWVLDPSTRGG